LKKVLCILTLIFLLTALSSGCGADESSVEETKAPVVISLQVGNPIITVGGKELAIDDESSVPVIIDGRTLLPVRAVFENIGGSVLWDEETRAVLLARKDVIITLSIGSESAFLNQEQHLLDVSPVIIGGRTMLPIRFIAESFGFDVSWNDNDKTVTLTEKTDITEELT